MKFLSLLFFLFIFTTMVAFSQVTIHIPGDYPTIQEGIDAANNGDIVLVADGLYYENINFMGKAITVASHYIQDGDKSHIENTIIDGSQPSHPDTGAVVSIISGEDTTSVLCGFTITGGTGTLGTSAIRAGGGISVYLGGAKICNNIIEYNSVNHTDYAIGGGIIVYSTNYVTIIKNNIIRNNSVNGTYPWGGGISLAFSELTYILSNKIIDNEATGTSAASGGGIDVAYANAETVINGNYIKGNDTQISGYGGGGIDLYAWGAPVTVSNNLIVDNNARWGGGILVDFGGPGSSKPDNLNAEDFSRTKKESTLSKLLQDEPVLVNNTIINNFGTIGGGIYTRYSTPDVMNNIVWGNTYTSGGQINGAATVTYSDVEGSYPGPGNINVDPGFIDSTYFCLCDTSGCIDAGNPDPMYNDVEDPNNSGFALYPAMGTLRNDMGTFGGPNSTWSLVLSDTLYVPSDYSTIQAAIDAAINGNVVLVAEDTYYENINYKGKAITVASYFLIDGNESHIENTIIDGSQPSNPDRGSVVSFVSGEDTTSILCGFTITGGTGTYSAYWNEFAGGGIYCSQSGAKIIYNKITENEVIYSNWATGGGIFMSFEEEQYWTVIENNIISNNYAEADPPAAGGIFIGNNAKINNNIIENNTCFSATQQDYIYGGGICVDGSIYWTHTIYCQNNIIRNNTISGGFYNGGAGIWMDDGDFYIVNNDINNNHLELASSREQGAGLLITSPDAECYIQGNKFSSNTGDANSDGTICIRDAEGTSIMIDGNTIEDNDVAEGGGLFALNLSNVSITNNLFVKNTANGNGGAIKFSSAEEKLKTVDAFYGRDLKQTSRVSTEVLLYTQPVLINNTFTGNTSMQGGAIYNDATVELIILNTIFWDNAAPTGKDLYQSGTQDIYIYYSDIETDSIFGNWTGDGNIYANPLFVNATIGDYHLQNTSPCLQTGIDSIDIGGTMHYCPPFCIYGVPRPSPAGTLPDMGACENQNPVGIQYDLTLIPEEYSLSQNYPNPFNPTTTIVYGLRERTNVEMILYDVLGSEIEMFVNGEQDAGFYEIEFNASRLASGIYFYRLQAGDFIQTKKMVLMK